jgi:hypothetical protein
VCPARAKDIMGGSSFAGARDVNSSEFKPKLYYAMDSNEESIPSREIDKGKGIDRVDTENVNERESVAKPLDKGKGIDRRVHPLPVEAAHSTEPHMVT